MSLRNQLELAGCHHGLGWVGFLCVCVVFFPFVCFAPVVFSLIPISYPFPTGSVGSQPPATQQDGSSRAGVSPASPQHLPQTLRSSRSRQLQPGPEGAQISPSFFAPCSWHRVRSAALSQPPRSEGHRSHRDALGGLGARLGPGCSPQCCRSVVHQPAELAGARSSPGLFFTCPASGLAPAAPAGERRGRACFPMDLLLI